MYERRRGYPHDDSAAVFYGADVAPEGIYVDGGSNTLVRDLDLPPGYFIKRSKAETCLIDPDGRKVMSLPASVASRSRDEEPTQEEWRALCRGLLVRLSAQSAECERLRIRAARLEERAETAEAERDQSNAIAEDLYSFFRRRVQEVVDHRTNLERR